MEAKVGGHLGQGRKHCWSGAEGATPRMELSGLIGRTVGCIHASEPRGSGQTGAGLVPGTVSCCFFCPLAMQFLWELWVHPRAMHSPPPPPLKWWDLQVLCGTACALRVAHSPLQ